MERNGNIKKGKKQEIYGSGIKGSFETTIYSRKPGRNPPSIRV